MSARSIAGTYDVCVVGADPAGLVLGLELARYGARVAVLDEAPDFECAFPGETVMPDAGWVLDRLGLLDGVGRTERLTGLDSREAGATVFTIDFTAHRNVPNPCPLELSLPRLRTEIARTAAAEPGFTLALGLQVTDLLRGTGGRIAGVRVAGLDGGDRAEVRARLVVGSDGRASAVRELSGLPYRTITTGRDLFRFEIPLPEGRDPHLYRAHAVRDLNVAMAPTVFDTLRFKLDLPAAGPAALRGKDIAELWDRIDLLVPEYADAVRAHVTSWADVLRQEIVTTAAPSWTLPGLVLIGDAAHTFTSLIGQSINHALLDAVTLAPLVADALSGAGTQSAGEPGDAPLDRAAAEFQRLREASIEASRKAQLRQERVAGFSGRFKVALRTRLFRKADRDPVRKRRFVTGIYHGFQTAALSGGGVLRLAMSESHGSAASASAPGREG